MCARDRFTLPEVHCFLYSFVEVVTTKGDSERFFHNSRVLNLVFEIIFGLSGYTLRTVEPVSETPLRCASIRSSLAHLLLSSHPHSGAQVGPLRLPPCRGCVGGWGTGLVPPRPRPFWRFDKDEDERSVTKESFTSEEVRISRVSFRPPPPGWGRSDS